MAFNLFTWVLFWPLSTLWAMGSSPGRVKPGVLESLGGGGVCACPHAGGFSHGCERYARHISRGAIHVVSRVSDSLRLGLNCSHENANSTSSGYGPSPPGSVSAFVGGVWGPRETILHVLLTHALHGKLV